MYGESLIRLTADFSSEAMDAIREWDDIFKVLKEKQERRTCQELFVADYPSKMKKRISYPQVKTKQIKTAKGILCK